MASWKWLADGKSVEVTSSSKEVRTFKGATIKESEWAGFYDKIADEGEVHAILKRARAAFVVGSANYADARANLGNLIVELNASASAIYKIAQDVGVFFEPTDLVLMFKGDNPSLVDFALDFSARTYVRGVNGG